MIVEPSPIEEHILEYGVDQAVETPIEIEENKLVEPKKQFESWNLVLKDFSTIIFIDFICLDVSRITKEM